MNQDKEDDLPEWEIEAIVKVRAFVKVKAKTIYHAGASVVNPGVFPFAPGSLVTGIIVSGRDGDGIVQTYTGSVEDCIKRISECSKSPKGMYCTRKNGHEGPCELYLEETHETGCFASANRALRMAGGDRQHSCTCVKQTKKEQTHDV